MRPLAAIVVIGLCILSVGQTAMGASLHGIVTCEEGCRIDGAVLTLSGAQDYSVRSVSGNYQFTNVTEGNYTLTVERDGYETWSRAVAVDGDAKVDVLLIEDESEVWPWVVFGVMTLAAVVAVAFAASLLLRGRDA